MKENRSAFFILIVMFLFLPCVKVSAAATGTGALNQEYEEYLQRFEGIKTSSQIARQGFQIIEEHSFPLTVEHYGEVSFIPALDRRYGRLAVFLVQEDGTVLYKTEQLETNSQNRGELKQPNKGIAAVSFQDVNLDGLTDILIITFGESQSGTNAGKTHKIGDVLFQQPDSGKQLFYRDYRISSKLNLYGMNKSIKFMVTYLVDEYSTEFLYLADTLDELVRNGFLVDTYQSYWYEFEKWGRLFVVGGSYGMAEYTVFMVYLVNEQGYIVWSFQPMRDYESLYVLRGINCLDIDGDGLRDIIVLAQYIFEQTDNESAIAYDYSVYYQRGNGFYEDTAVKAQYPCQEEDTMAGIIERLRAYWGWSQGI